jgi:hypothetical protein
LDLGDDLEHSGNNRHCHFDERYFDEQPHLNKHNIDNIDSIDSAL